MNDLISRQAVLMSLADYQLQESPNWGANGMGNTDAYEAITECIRVIEQAPTIDPVKRGKWEKIIGDGKLGKQVRCGHCGEQFWAWMAQFRYCPNCGARMDGEE